MKIIVQLTMIFNKYYKGIAYKKETQHCGE